jgi:hypothetical protein
VRRSTLILLILVTTLLAVILLWERDQPSTDESQKNRDKLITVDISKAGVISRSGASAVALTRRGEDRWEMTSPVRDAADRYGVEGFLERLGQLRVTRWVEKGTPPASLGLSSPRAVWTVAAESGTVKIEMGSDAALNAGVYARVDGRIGLLPKDSESLLLKSASDFRLKELTTLATQDVQSVDLARPQFPPLAFQRAPSGGWDVTAPYADWGEPNKIESMLDDLSLCPVESFIDDHPGDPGKYGLGQGATAIRVLPRKGKGPAVEIRLGSTVAGSEPQKRLVYATVSDRPSVMSVSLNSLKSLTQDPENYRSMDLFRHDFFDAAEVIFQGPQKAELDRGKDGGWHFRVPTPVPPSADATVLADALQGLRGEEALPHVDPTILGLDHPALSVEVRGKDFEERVVVGKDTTGRMVAKPANRVAALILPQKDWDRLEAALTVLSTKPGVSKP